MSKPKKWFKKAVEPANDSNKDLRVKQIERIIVGALNDPNPLAVD